MKTGRTLSELAAELDRQRTTKQDVIAQQNVLEMRLVERSATAPVLEPQLYVPDLDHAEPIRAIAHGQFASRLGIPKQYYDRMMREQPELLVRNVNTWFAQSGERRMVRSLDGYVRAFLSDKYQRIEHFDVAEVTLGVLGDLPGGMNIVSCEVTETRLYIKATFPHLKREFMTSTAVGEWVEAGVIVRNSEVGLGAFAVEPFAQVLRCTNGMVLPDGRFKGFHIGRRADEREHAYILADDTRKADDRAIMLKARDFIRAATDEVLFAQRIDKMSGTTTRSITGNPTKAVEVLAQFGGLTEDESGSVMRHLITGGDVSQWGLINAVTRSAQDADSYDRATELETLGGQMLDMAPGQWKQIAEAA